MNDKLHSYILQVPLHLYKNFGILASYQQDYKTPGSSSPLQERRHLHLLSTRLQDLGEKDVAKTPRFLFTIEKIGTFVYIKGFVSPFPNYQGFSSPLRRSVSSPTSRGSFPRFQATKVSFHHWEDKDFVKATKGFAFPFLSYQGIHFPVSKLHPYIHKVALHLQQERRCLSCCLRLFQDSRVLFHHESFS